MFSAELRAVTAMALGLGIVASAAGAEASLQSRIEARARAFRGTLGVAAKNLATGEEVSVNGDRRFPTASLIKVAVMVETHHRIAEGTLRRETVRVLADADRAGDEPVVLNQLHAGLSLTVADLLALMISFSDNTATNMLVGMVGTANVDRRMEAYGLRDTKLFRPTFRDGRADVFPELEKEFGLGMTTPKEAARLMELIAEGKILGRAVSDEMLALLERQQDRAMIPRSLPFERDRIVVANKTGWDEEKLPDASGLKGEIRTDAAYVRGPRSRYVIAICARRGKDRRATVDNEALRAGAEISRMVYDAFERGPDPARGLVTPKATATR